MPYYIYRISPQRMLSLVDAFAEYRPARDAARQMRQHQQEDDSDILKIVFAEDRDEAESLLKIRRERQPSEDD